MKRTFCAVAIGLTCVLLAVPQPASAASLNIDSFDDGAFDMIANSGTPTVTDSQSGLSGVLGGRRDAAAMWMSGPGRVRLTVLPTPGILALSSDALTDGDAMLTYPGLSLNVSSYVSIDLSVLSADQQGIPISVQLTDGGGAMATSGDIAAGAGVVVQIPLSNYSSLDLTNIAEIKLTIDPPQEFDISLDEFSFTVPEPGSLLLVSAALAGLAVWRRPRG